jgi:hypothetical protein
VGEMNTFNEWVNNVVQEDIYGRTDGQPVTKTANLHTNYTVTKEHYFVTFIELDLISHQFIVLMAVSI